MKVKQKNSGKNQIINNEERNIYINEVQGQKFINLVDEGHLTPHKKISFKEQNEFYLKFFTGILLTFISLIADIMQINPVFHLPLWVYTCTFIVIILVASILYFPNFSILFSNSPKKGECIQLYNDTLLEKEEEGYALYSLTCNCVYPNCSGKVKITSKPERYNGNFSFYAQCTLAGKQHSYGIDYNLNAYPKEIDWRPQENQMN